MADEVKNQPRRKLIVNQKVQPISEDRAKILNFAAWLRFFIG